MVTSSIGECQAFFADDISQCVVGQTARAANSIFNSSIFQDHLFLISGKATLAIHSAFKFHLTF